MTSSIGSDEPPDSTGTINACVPTLARDPLLGSFSAEDWSLFVRYLEIVAFPPGATIVREASEGQDMYFIVDGEAHLRRAHIDLGAIRQGDHFGELALISRRLRAASIVAVTPLRVARLSRVRYDAMSAEAPALALRFTQAIVSSLGSRLTEMTDSVGLLLHERSLPRRTQVEVQVDRETRLVKTGTKLGSLFPADVAGSMVVAGLLNHKAVSLDTPITSDASIAPLTADHWEGRRVYRHSLGLLLLEAAKRVDPTASVRLGPSMGFAQRVEMLEAPTLEPVAWAKKVTSVMKALITIDAAFRQELWTVEEARSHFEERGWYETASLLRTLREPALPLVSCGELYALSMTPLLPSTGPIGAVPFRLAPSERGFLLYYGDEEEIAPAEEEAPALDPLAPSEPPPATVAADPAPGSEESSDDDPPETQPAPRPLRSSLPEEEPFLAALGVTSAGAFNEACILGNVAQIIRVSEGLHEKRIGQIADRIAERAGHVRVICIAGPSASGKTTFIKRLTVQLQVNGIHPVGISLDDYYKDRDKITSGDSDFEAVEAIDVALFQDQLRRLLAREAVAVARYDFLRGKSMPGGGPTVALRGTDILLVEGIHGLNPRVFGPTVTASEVFRIFLQPMTALPFDRLSRVSVSDIRLLRRIVRDRYHRGTNAADNILRWPSVRAGEQSHIFPFLGHADAMFDSSLVYEPSVIKVFADRYLLEVPQEHPAFATAHRLRQLIDRFVTIYPDHVPPTSILREFIGGSGFEY